MEDARVKKWMQRYEALQGKRLNWDGLWQRCAEMMLPHKGRFTRKFERGQNLQSHLKDGVGTRGLIRFAGGLASRSTPASSQWFYLRVDAPDLREERSVETWLGEAARIMLRHLNGQAGFHLVMTEAFKELGAFGTAVVFFNTRGRSAPLFQCIPLHQCYLAVNSLDEVDTCYRVFQFTAEQAFQAFGEVVKAGALKDALEKGSMQEFDILHLVEPHPQNEGEWVSAYLSLSDKQALHEGEFQTFPYAIGRWDKSAGEVYGRSPGMNALGDIESLNTLRDETLLAAKLQTKPPLEMPTFGYNGPANIRPGALNIYDPTLNPNQRIQPMNIGANFQAGEAMHQRLELAVHKSFYLDILEGLPAPVSPNGAVQHMSATEVSSRMQLAVVNIAPFVERVNHEMRAPLIERLFKFMLERGMFGQPPDELTGRDYAVAFVSPLDTLINSTDVASIMQFGQIAAQIGQLSKMVGPLLDTDAAVRLTAKVLRVPEVVLRSEEEVNAILQAKADEQAEQQQMAAQQQETSTLVDTSKAAKNFSQAGV